MVDSSFLVKAIEIVKRATEEDANQDYEEAFKLYQHALDYFVAAMKCESGIGKKTRGGDDGKILYFPIYVCITYMSE